MALNWIEKQNQIDIIDANDVNAIAHAVTDNETSINGMIANIDNKADTTYVDAEVGRVFNHIAEVATNLYNTKADITYVDEKLGDVETALDGIIALQTSILGA